MLLNTIMATAAIKPFKQIDFYQLHEHKLQGCLPNYGRIMRQLVTKVSRRNSSSDIYSNTVFHLNVELGLATSRFQTAILR